MTLASTRLRAAATAALLCSCSGGDGGVAIPDAAAPDAGRLDFGRAHWELRSVSQSRGNSDTSPDLTITPDGELVAAWVQFGGGEGPIFTAESGPDWAPGLRARDAGVNLSAPSLAAGANAVHLVWSGPGGATNSDIFYARRQGGIWSTPVNVTGPGDVDNLVQFDPTIVDLGDSVAVLFSARVSSMVPEPDGIYALRFSDPGSPGQAEIVLDRAEFDCIEFAAAVDPAGAIHVAANCTQSSDPSEVFYLTDRGGGWTRQTVDSGDSRSPLSPDIALSADGSLVHVVWNGTYDCGPDTCRDVFYSRDLAAASSATNGSADGGFIPRVAVDDLGRVVVAFHLLGDVDDVLWTYSEGGAGFVRTQLVTPGSPSTTDFSAGRLRIDALTGRPHVVFIRSFGTNDSDVFHAELVP